MSEETIKVAVRIRPLIKKENDRGYRCVISKVALRPQVSIQTGKSTDYFTFDYVFGGDESQEMVYQNSVKSMVVKLFKGYNVTILAYGQTGSGKTHTMGTAYNGNLNDEIGVIPRAITDIFEIANSMEDHTITISCSFIELYQEQLIDLLSENGRDQSVVDIREDSNRGIVIPNLTERLVKTSEDTTKYLMKGSSGRVVGQTAMNDCSSRSHAIFTVNVQVMKTNDPSSSTKAKFHLVDLAGSERPKKTLATGDRFKEGVKINQGLLALGNVISALGTHQNSNTFVSYRDSKLTRLLQDSLGGNSLTLMIACVSPADYNMDETQSTLRYADRAKQIKNKPVINQDPKTAEIQRLNEIIQNLRLELLSKGGTRRSVYATSTVPATNDTEVQKQIDALQKDNDLLQRQLESMFYDISNMEDRLNNAEVSNESLIQHLNSIKEILFTINLDTLNSETCPAEFIVQSSKINEIKEILEKIDLIMKDAISNTTATIDVSNSTFVVPNDGLPAEIENEEDISEKLKDFTTRQETYRDQLKKLKQELELKQELHTKLNGNFTNFCSIEHDFKQEKLKNYEEIIANLEKERDELLAETQKTKKTQTTAKLSEERRKRVQSLEQEIVEMKKKNRHQSMLLKQREKDQCKILVMQKDIQTMKQAKVKLIRTMKAESESFRQWKLTREKELLQLREKDRRRENEMKKRDLIHERKENVLKRKVEEAIAVNKRLKDALEKRQNAQASRKKIDLNGKIDQLGAWLSEDLEIIFSVIEAKQSLDQLIADRGKINFRLVSLKKQKNADQETLDTLQEDIDLRNAQISDLQEKIKTCDIDTKIKNIHQNVQSMSEAKSIIKLLLDSVSNTHLKYNEIRLTLPALMEDIQMKETENEKLKEEKLKIEKDCEEKFSVLLRELANSGKSNTECNSIQDDVVDRLLEKIRLHEEEIAHLKTQMGKRKPLRNKSSFQTEANYETSDTDDDSYPDDTHDPDWRKTPMVREKRSSRRKNLSKSETDNEKHKCSCKTNCKRNNCGCRKSGQICNDLCKCLNCENNEMNRSVESTKRSSSMEENEENDSNVTNANTPKKMKLFDESDQLTPYPYANKKREPFYRDII